MAHVNNVLHFKEKEMSFKEKSAWVMLIALVLGGLCYCAAVMSMSSANGTLAPPNLPAVAIYSVILIIITVIGHIVIAIMAPKDANAMVDERERIISDRASHRSGYVFSVGVLLSLGFYLFGYNGNILFYAVLGSLMVAQLTECVFQIISYRTAV
ncbi:MAG: putative membrane protein [Candidatus Azotimanducaceae bacterium]